MCVPGNLNWSVTSIYLTKAYLRHTFGHDLQPWLASLLTIHGPCISKHMWIPYLKIYVISQHISKSNMLAKKTVVLPSRMNAHESHIQIPNKQCLQQSRGMISETAGKFIFILPERLHHWFCPIHLGKLIHSSLT